MLRATIQPAYINACNKVHSVAWRRLHADGSENHETRIRVTQSWDEIRANMYDFDSFWCRDDWMWPVDHPPQVTWFCREILKMVQFWCLVVLLLLHSRFYADNIENFSLWNCRDTSNQTWGIIDIPYPVSLINNIETNHDFALMVLWFCIFRTVIQKIKSHTKFKVPRTLFFKGARH